jgi:hypothetical protein
MKKLWLLLAIAVPLQFIHAQEVKHAPTVEQCRADEKLWMSKRGDDAAVVDITYGELDGWIAKMYECQTVDPGNRVQYYNMQSELAVRQVMRLEKFIRRHNLWDQFLAEDAQGKGR